MSYYDVAQICMNGHIITDRANSSPQLKKSHCTKCGEPTITNCVNCNSPIQGFYHVDGVVRLGYKPILHSFCYHCGKPYPWIEKQIIAAKELIDEIDDLDIGEREKLKQSIDDIITDNPRNEVATVRIKKLLPKVGIQFGGALKEIIVSLASEAAKKMLMG